MTKTIDTLIEDIYGLFDGPTGVDDHLLDNLAQEIVDVIRMRLTADRDKEPTLRMSNVGKPDRQVWYEINGTEGQPEPLRPETHLLFLFGDLWEAVLLYLAEQAGHKVEGKQREVELNGILGHIDCIIDGVLVDVKSASPAGFKKFTDGSISEDDPFGYMDQLSGYSIALGNLDGGHLAVNKVTGKLALQTYPKEDLKALDISSRIDHIRDVVESPEPPERCYEPVPEGASGNQTLALGCRYCKFKFDCWSDTNNGMGLRTFLYSTGPKHFTKVAKEPRTKELTI